MKKFLTAAILIFTLFTCYSQEVLDGKSASWQIVVPGELITAPVETSYGFTILTDARNIISYSEKGTVLWEQSIKKTTNPIFTSLPDDFYILITNNGKKLSVLNPSGYEIWNKNLDFSVMDKPYIGRDGRFFVRNEKTIICFGMNGIQKWKLETPVQTQMPIQEFPDGSFVVFLKETDGGKTKGLRISPFGEILEEIVFSGSVLSTTTCSKGILLTFDNGNNGLCSLQDNKATNKWVIKNLSSDQSQNYFISSYDKEEIIYIAKNNGITTVNFVNINTGELQNSFNTEKLSTLTNVTFNKTGIFLTDSTNAYFYNHRGELLWNAIFPNKSKKTSWTYFMYTPDNYLLIFDSNWTVNSFLTYQNLKKVKETINKKNYFDFYNLDASYFDSYYQPDEIDRTFASQERIDNLKNGDYSTNEIEWASDLISACMAKKEIINTVNSNSGYKTQKSVFETDKIGVELMLYQLSLFGTDSFNQYIADFLANETEPAFIKKLLFGITENGYDPDRKILDALYVLSRKTNKKDDVMLFAICDAVYSICKFMGKPAYYEKGKEILTNMIYPNYSDKTRNYARQIFKKISELDY